jgi:hypothetical protein
MRQKDGKMAVITFDAGLRLPARDAGLEAVLDGGFALPLRELGALALEAGLEAGAAFDAGFALEAGLALLSGLLYSKNVSDTIKETQRGWHAKTTHLLSRRCFGVTIGSRGVVSLHLRGSSLL